MSTPGRHGYGGLYPAVVTALASDPASRQRIEVELPWLDGAPRLWATVITPYADADQGLQMLPDVGSTVVVGFEAGNLRHPYLVGAVWNGTAQAPEAFTDRNDKRLIRTRSGCLLEFDDTPGAVKITVRTPGGHELVLDDGGLEVELRASNGSRIELTPAGGVTISANTTVHVTAAMVTVDAPMSQFNGIVKCDTLIATTGVVSPSYTPGAGNVW